MQFCSSCDVNAFPLVCMCSQLGFHSVQSGPYCQKLNKDEAIPFPDLSFPFLSLSILSPFSSPSQLPPRSCLDVATALVQSTWCFTCSWRQLGKANSPRSTQCATNVGWHAGASTGQSTATAMHVLSLGQSTSCCTQASRAGNHATATRYDTRCYFNVRAQKLTQFS